MLAIGGTIVLNSGLEVVKGEIDDKLALKLAVGSEGLGALLGIKPGNVSEDKLAEGIKGKVEGKDEMAEELDGRLRELEAVESSGDGTSGKEAGMFCAGKLEAIKFEPGKFEVGKFEVGRFDAPTGKLALKLGYCIGCCMEGGIDNPGGGRSKDCWCKWGSPFGGP